MSENLPQAPLTSTFATLVSLKSLWGGALRDTISSQGHSRDFAYARIDYLRSRVFVVGIIFLLLTPFWAIIDAMMLPDDTRSYVMAGRIAMVLGLVLATLMAWRSTGKICLAKLSASVLFGVPAAFYVFVLAGLPAQWSGSLVGYSFIPFMLMVMLSIFPFTLIESAALGVVLLAVECYAQHVGGGWMTSAGIQAIWLLAALMCITLTSNYFHLGLLLRLYREATHDPLTGLLNRGALIQSLAQVRRANPEQPMSLLMMDLDYFKRINDQYGHSVGDMVLRQFAQLLRQTVGRADLVARYGGEEFVAVLTNHSKEKAIALAEDLRKRVETTSVTSHDGEQFNFTVSIGVATLHADEAFDSAARRADDRLYEAKKTSRNCVVGV